MPGIVSVETHSGNPVQTNGLTLIPFSQVVQVRLPGVPAGLVWNRPQSVLVTDNAGQEHTLPIRDITRQIVWSLLGAAGLMAIIYWIIGQNGKE